MSNIRFTSTKLNGRGKKGILTPDADGYYEMAIGGLNVFNSAGEYYTLAGARDLFEQSSVFMRRVKNGCLKAEVGHPKRLPGQSMDDYIRRILTIDESNICAHFRDVWLDTTFGQSRPDLKNPLAVAIMARVCPSGPKAFVLESAIKNTNENVCFSIRALTEDHTERGITHRVLNTIVSFDLVNEPGISYANKFDSPALENIADEPILVSQLERVAKASIGPIALESASIAHEAIQALREKQRAVKIPLYLRWS